VKGFTKDKKFHPIKPYIKVRKKKEPFQVKKTEGVPMEKLIQMQRADVGRRKRYAHQQMELPIDMSVREQMEWEQVVGSEIVKVKHEMINGMPVTSVRFANGEEWFEFDNIDHQEEFMKENDLHKHEGAVGEFVEVDHPLIAGFVTMPSGKVVFGEREDTREKREEPMTTEEQHRTGFDIDEERELDEQAMQDIEDKQRTTRKSRGSMTEILPTNGKATVKLHTSGRGDRGTQFTLGIGNQLSDIGIWNVSQTGIDQIESTITDASRQGMINSKDDMFKLSRMLQSIIEERIEDGDIK